MSRLLTPRQKVAIVACSLLAIMLADIYLLPGSQQAEIVYDGAVLTGHGSRGTIGKKSYVLNAKSGNKYAVPVYVYNAINVEEPFTVKKTFLFGRALQLTFCNPGCGTYAIGTFNSDYFSQLLVVVIFLVTLLVATGIIKTNRRAQLTYGIFGIAFGIFIVYLIF